MAEAQEWLATEAHGRHWGGLRRGQDVLLHPLLLVGRRNFCRLQLRLQLLYLAESSLQVRKEYEMEGERGGALSECRREKERGGVVGQNMQSGWWSNGMMVGA